MLSITDPLRNNALLEYRKPLAWISLLVLAGTMILAGCATPALIDKATHDKHVRSPITADYSLRVKSAWYFDKHRTLGICIERVHGPTGTAEEFFLHFPDPHRLRYETRFGQPYYQGYFADKNGVLVATGDLPAQSGRTCRSDGKNVALIELPLDASVALPPQVDMAVVYAYQNGQLATLGYASKAPFFDNRHSYVIDITRTSAYYTDKIEKGDRALLLLTPFAAAVDAAGFVLIAPPLALKCIREPGWCSD